MKSRMIITSIFILLYILLAPNIVISVGESCDYYSGGDLACDPPNTFCVNGTCQVVVNATIFCTETDVENDVNIKGIISSRQRDDQGNFIEFHETDFCNRDGYSPYNSCNSSEYECGVTQHSCTDIIIGLYSSSELDCTGDCSDGVCVSLTDQCNDGILNGDESDTDCGGSCSYCENGRSCISNSDCGDGSECKDSICQTRDVFHCIDDIQNYDEEGIDCGGDTCNPCDEVSQEKLIVEIGENDPGDHEWTYGSAEINSMLQIKLTANTPVEIYRIILNSTGTGDDRLDVTPYIIHDVDGDGIYDVSVDDLMLIAGVDVDDGSLSAWFAQGIGLQVNTDESEYILFGYHVLDSAETGETFTLSVDRVFANDLDPENPQDDTIEKYLGIDPVFSNTKTIVDASSGDGDTVPDTSGCQDGDFQCSTEFRGFVCEDGVYRRLMTYDEYIVKCAECEPDEVVCVYGSKYILFCDYRNMWDVDQSEWLYKKYCDEGYGLSCTNGETRCIFSHNFTEICENNNWVTYKYPEQFELYCVGKECNNGTIECDFDTTTIRFCDEGVLWQDGNDDDYEDYCGPNGLLGKEMDSYKRSGKIIGQIRDGKGAVDGGISDERVPITVVPDSDYTSTGPDDNPPLIPGIDDWLLYLLIAIIIAAIIGVLYYLKKRKKR